MCSGLANREIDCITQPGNAVAGKTRRLRVIFTFGCGRCSTGCCLLKLVSVCFLDSRRHVGDCLQPGASWQSAASCLLATAYPAVVPALLSGIYFGCGSKGKKIRELVILILYFLKKK